jgi:hypothetical protein
MKHLVAHHPNKGKNNDSDSPATFMEETFSQKKTKCSEKSTRWIFFFLIIEDFISSLWVFRCLRGVRHQEIHTFSLGNIRKYQKFLGNTCKFQEILGIVRKTTIYREIQNQKH